MPSNLDICYTANEPESLGMGIVANGNSIRDKQLKPQKSPMNKDDIKATSALRFRAKRKCGSGIQKAVSKLLFAQGTTGYRASCGYKNAHDEDGRPVIVRDAATYPLLQKARRLIAEDNLTKEFLDTLKRCHCVAVLRLKRLAESRKSSGQPKMAEEIQPAFGARANTTRPTTGAQDQI